MKSLIFHPSLTQNCSLMDLTIPHYLLAVLLAYPSLTRLTKTPRSWKSRMTATKLLWARPGRTSSTFNRPSKLRFKSSRLTTTETQTRVKLFLCNQKPSGIKPLKRGLPASPSKISRSTSRKHLSLTNSHCFRSKSRLFTILTTMNFSLWTTMAKPSTHPFT